jgi:hypothetical protein
MLGLFYFLTPAIVNGNFLPRITIDSQPSQVGNVLEERGNDFLAPNAIGRMVNRFANSVSPTQLDTALFSPVSVDALLGKNPSGARALDVTQDFIAQVQTANYFSNPAIPGPVNPSGNFTPGQGVDSLTRLFTPVVTQVDLLNNQFLQTMQWYSKFLA